MKMAATLSTLSQELISSGSSTPKKIMLNFRKLGTQVHHHSRCRPDLFDQNIICIAKETGDDRQFVSHFFGRNKVSTASIPKDYFPMLCRKHYQERFYRWKEDPGAYAGYQCDNILKVLRKMSKRRFIDEHGNQWPWWCGFDLRLVQDTGGNPPRSGVPEWLYEMCLPITNCRNEELADVKGVRYDLEQLVSIVEAIRGWCIENDSSLPRVQALPVTIGMCDREASETSKKELREAEARRNLAFITAQRLEAQVGTPPAQITRGSKALESAIEQVYVQRETVRLAMMDAGTSAATLPPKRETKAESGQNTQTLVCVSSASVSTQQEIRTSEKRYAGAETDRVVRKRARSGLERKTKM